MDAPMNETVTIDDAGRSGGVVLSLKSNAAARGPLAPHPTKKAELPAVVAVGKSSRSAAAAGESLRGAGVLTRPSFPGARPPPALNPSPVAAPSYMSRSDAKPGRPRTLTHFVEAQGKARAGYATALAEITAGRKTSHWIWYIWPLLKGVGKSGMCIKFELLDAADARVYLLHDLLGLRLREITAVAHRHVCGTGTSPLTLMGSGIDVYKLVSCLTLFEAVCASMAARADPAYGAGVGEFHAHCTAILDKLAFRWPRCPKTLASLDAS